MADIAQSLTSAWDAVVSFLWALTDFSLFWLTVGAAGISTFLLVTVIRRLNGAVPEEDRTYMDPLSPMMRMIWPVIRILAHNVCSYLPYEYLDYTQRRLSRTGVSYLMTAEQFVALRLVSAVVFTLATWLVMTMLEKSFPAIYIVMPLLGFLFPDVWLSDTRKRRELAVVRAMPVYLDFITMCVEAGLNLQGALQQALEKAPPGPLRNEFATVLRDLRAGLARADALRRMSDRLDIPEVTGFVSAVIQAERMGASLASVMRVQAEQRRSERFQRAEKLAMEAPVKLVFPLIVFIFPVTFMVLAFPIIMKFLGEGIL